MDKRQYPEVNTMSAFLCLCVIAIHLTATPISQLTPGSIPHTGLFLINRALSFSVPGFLFLSGFKLYSHYGMGTMDVKAFYCKRLRGVLLPYFVAVLVYFAYYYAKGWVSVSKLPEYLLLGTLVSHFYYIVIAAQFYLLFPVLKWALNRLPVLTVGISAVCTLAFYTLFRFPRCDRFVGTYLIYFVLGMLFQKYRLGERCLQHRKILFSCFLLMAAPHLAALYLRTCRGLQYSLANAVSVLYCCAAVCVVYTLCALVCQKWPTVLKLAQPLSRVSFSVYLYHMMLIVLLQYDLFPRFALTPKEQFLISCLVVYGLVFAWTTVSGQRKKMP